MIEDEEYFLEVTALGEELAINIIRLSIGMRTELSTYYFNFITRDNLLKAHSLFIVFGYAGGG